MRRTRYDAYAAACPTRQALDRMADKWTVLVVGSLGRRPHRFGELRRGINSISPKMLTQTLRSLEADAWSPGGFTPPFRSPSNTR